MKSIHNLLLISSLIGSFSLSGTVFTPDKTVIVSDIDDVILQKNKFHELNLILDGISQNPLNEYRIYSIPKFFRALCNFGMSYSKSARNSGKGLYDDNGNPIESLTFNLLYQGMRDKEFTPYVSWMANTVGSSHTYINDTKKMYTYLKEKKGYQFMFATNKDRISHDITAQALGSEFSHIPTKTLVTYPTHKKLLLEKLNTFAQQKDVPDSYKKLLAQAAAAQPSNSMYHSEKEKPSNEYYQNFHSMIEPEKNVIFIDDKKKNIEGFEHLEHSPDTTFTGICFKNPVDLARTFVKMGILSETEDKQLLEEIHYSAQ